MLGLVVAQLITTVVDPGVGFLALQPLPEGRAGAARRRPQAVHPLRALRARLHRPDSFRTWIAPLRSASSAAPTAVGLFRGAQAPQTRSRVLSAPVRMILLSEQTRDWEHGRPEIVIAGLRRYIVGSALLMAAILAARAELLMPWLVPPAPRRRLRCRRSAPRSSCSPRRRSSSSSAGRSRSRSRSAGPGLRVVAHAVEVAVLLPLILVFGELWGVTGGGAAVFVSTLAFAATWVVIVLRLRGAPAPARERGHHRRAER